ncbi:hypothetical protein PCANC_20741 [Puccinia coronata f. sp. avenae]|uniref:PAS domain-containing protein n=1 Tax=Puccinia coronata f. sp. avenae TaxID=200324 RepID=A0A2N5RY54_9BASI|nr:hypothetical protein PCASD_25601 [Puccinia coronata f. sp. avenae]PLW09705.1 hypothetical protein PCANC_20741 [Puccinia coronata f. sp. avenae]PLW37346.1 hypothetical protein PCASD_09675 [Puccinia coronata f. sp. avenae]
MAAFSHSLMDFLCFDPHSSTQQDRVSNPANPFSPRSAASFSNPKFLSSPFFDPPSFSPDNNHHQAQQREQQQHQLKQYHSHSQQPHSAHPFHHPFLSSNHQSYINELDEHQNRFDHAANPYSVTNSPGQLAFIMPTFAKGASNHFSLDGPSYAEPILTLPYSSDDSNRFSSADPTQASTTAAANSTDHQSFPFPSDISDIPSPPFTTRTKSISSQSPSKSSFNNSVHGSSSAITPPTTSSSRNPSELNLDEIFATSDPLTHSKSHSPDLKHGFSQHFKPPENPYSQTGFDLIGALARVVNRPDPKVKIGAVDASAALVVVDARQNDLPIIFATPSFSLLTGYKTEEIIGQNCRFLQKPFNPNSANQPTDQTANCRATLQIRAHIQAGREIQSSIINYRKDGRAFVNLVTVIPIAWNSSGISHFVGFQADIAALTSGLGIPPSPQSRSNLLMAKQHNVNTITETSTSQKTLNLVSVTPQVATPESMVPSSTAQAHDAIDDLSNTSSYYQTVLQESRDLTLAISLKGTFFYASPSCQDILGYGEDELVNQNISKICHASDLTGILRQLKLIGNTAHTPLDLVFRALNRNGDVFWMEFQGQLHVENGKGRKYLVLVGRPRTIGPLSWQAIRSAGGLGETEFWMKLSLDGLCLFATSPVREILSYESAEMVGQSLTQMCAPDQRGLLINAIRTAYEGNDIVTLVYSLADRNGAMVSVVSDFYPPHFLSGPRACGLPSPASKLTHPPRTIFCQTNSLTSALQRPEKQPRAQDVSSSYTRRFSGGTTSEDPLANPEPTNPPPTMNPAPMENSVDPSPVIRQSSVVPDMRSDDDLFSPLGTNKTTPWNYEFSQLKRQNVKLRSELTQRGLGHHLGASSASKSKEQGCTRSAKNVHTSRHAAGNPPYPSRLRLHSTSTMSVEDAPPGSATSEQDPTCSGISRDKRSSIHSFQPPSFLFDDPNRTQNQ